MPDPAILRAALLRGLRATLDVTLDCARAMVPAVIVVTLLDRSGWLARLGAVAAPVMDAFGLPGGAALALIVGNVVGLYSGFAAAVPLGLDYVQWTVIGTMIAISHAQPIEMSLIARAGGNPWLVLAARLLASALAGLLLHAVLG